MNKVIRVGSRESKLAMVQTHMIIDQIKMKFPKLEFEIISLKTTGDIILDRSLDKIGGKGLFIKELEQALIDGTVDMAVHSMKDLPAEIHEELMIAAVSKREDPRDALLTLKRGGLETLSNAAIVGTSSARREVQLRDLRPDLHVKLLRGNVITRINKLENGEYDGIILALAGLKRLGLESRCDECFDVKEMIPAVGQGILGIEVRKGADIDFLLESIHDEESFSALTAERAYMIKLEGGCSTPIAAYATIEGENMRVNGMLALADKSKLVRASIEGKRSEARILGEKLADIILEKLGQM